METNLKNSKRDRNTMVENGSRPKYDAKARPLWEIACELGARLSEEELTKIPTDASANLHHYLYSAPPVER